MKRFVLICLFCFSAVVIFAQSKPQIINEIEDLIAKENYKQANEIVKQRTALFLKNKNIDTLGYYVVYLGKTTDKLKGIPEAKNELLSFLKQAKETFPYHKTLIILHTKAAHYISSSGDHKWAYQLIQDLDKYFINNHNEVKNDLPKIYFALGDFCIRMGNPGQASAHYKQAMEVLKKIPNPDAEQMLIAYNSMGIVQHFEPDPDSALYWWKKALDMIPKLEKTPFLQYYRKSSIENNLGNAYSALGKQREALKMYESAFEDGKVFLASPEPHPQKKQAETYQFYTLDNIAKIYLDLGDLTRAYDVYYYSYQLKKPVFGEVNNEIDKATIFLATVLNYQHKYKQALEYSLQALANIKKSGDTGTSWEANAYNQSAMAYNGLHRKELATKYYEQAHRIHKQIDKGQIDQYYLNFTEELISFYANNNQIDKAIPLAKLRVTTLEKSQQGAETYLIQSLRSLTQTYYAAKDYNAALKTATQAVAVANKLLAASKDIIDSISVEKETSKLILTRTKSKYALLSKKDTTSIRSLLNELSAASKIIDRRKSILSEETDVNRLLSDNKELTDFIKQLNYELFKLSSNKRYIDKILSVHEGALYTRIRSRLDKQKAIRFVNIPDSVEKREAVLKAQIHTTLKGTNASDDKIIGYLKAVQEWNNFQKSLKQNYPEYYKMRYENADISLSEVSAVIPKDVTVIRYIFSREELFALVATKEKQQLVPLTVTNLREQIETLNEVSNDAIKTGAISFALYQQLWQPLEKALKTKRIVVIPDDLLYKLSFEMLTPVATHSFSQLAKKCLLNNYAISYHYSLLALNPAKKNADMKGNFVAFTPGFTEEEKNSYKLFAKNDSFRLDKTYLSLLPLPFTINLAEKIQTKLGGTLFSRTESTKEAFNKRAANHHIIHIGTHAESNNDYPEYSRLIFAKNSKKMNADNSVYLYDIYNCNLTSDLAVLTACESGKSGYQDGEGMISMAHAFNYAGSESIMTSLWKVDEQSTVQITEWFYENLQDGLTKDEALQKAKLQYLQNAKGRTVAPQYWAGLVIMGDTSAVEFKRTRPYWFIIAGSGLLLIAGYFVFKHSNRKTA